MIVIGYQGIGKSTVSKSYLECIDLESGNFYVDGKRDADWYKVYCNIAEHLSQQGYIVFISSHAVVREQLKKSKEKVVCCVPTLELKNKWIQRLEDRYNNSKLDKDYRALMNAKDRYKENILEIADSGFSIIWITEMNYDLFSLIYKEKENKK